jgi:hypothetical protein
VRWSSYRDLLPWLEAETLRLLGVLSLSPSGVGFGTRTRAGPG